MDIRNFIESRKFTVEQWYSKETNELKLSCLGSDNVVDILVLLADEEEASSAVVDNDHKLIGIISERDVIKYLSVNKRIETDLKVESLMSRNVKSGTLGLCCTDALKIMVNGDFRHLPIISDGRFIGILSLIDAAKARLMETNSQSNNVFDALKSCNADLPSVEINQKMHDAFEMLLDKKVPFLTVKSDGKVIDYLTSKEVNRIKLREKNQF